MSEIGTAELVGRLERMSIPEPNSGCWLWTATVAPNGYGRISVQGRMALAHRLSFQLFCRPLQPGEQACHRCDNRLCINPDHLFAGTAADNAQDAIKKGRRSAGSAWGGEGNPNRRLTENDVREIRRLHAAGARGVDLARAFGLTRSGVCEITKRRSWGALT